MLPVSTGMIGKSIVVSRSLPCETDATRTGYQDQSASSASRRFFSAMETSQMDNS